MFKKILVAFKFSKGGRLALTTGAQLAREQGAGLHIFHAMDYRLRRLEPTNPRLQQSRQECEDCLREEARPHIEGLSPVEFHCLPDDPAMGLCTTAIRLQADLIILGEHRSLADISFSRLDYIGMTVVDKAPCPVMIVPFR